MKQYLELHFRSERLLATCLTLITVLFFGGMMFLSYSKRAHAQDVALKVATGGTAGTYHQMFGELNQKCSNTLVLNEQTTNGSLDNLALMIGNKVNAGIMQEDILFLKKRTETALLQYRTLFTLAPEEVHIISLSAGKKEGGYFGGRFGGNVVTLNNINDLANRKVGSFGGSMVTAQVIKLQTNIPYQVFDVGSAANAVKALQEGTIDAIIAVGGSQLPWVEKLTSDFKILDIPESAANQLKEVYQKGTLSYPNLNASGVPTVSTQAVFITRQYRTPEYVNALASLRTCFYKNLPYLAEETGMHPKWASVKNQGDDGYKGNFTWYDLPGAATTATPIRRRQ